jgi:hypothetical protein
MSTRWGIATLTGDHLGQVADIVKGGIRTVLEVCVMDWVISLSRILLQCSILMNLFDPIRHQVYLQNGDVGIYCHGKIWLKADIILRHIDCGALPGSSSTGSICFLI